MLTDAIRIAREQGADLVVYVSPVSHAPTTVADVEQGAIIAHCDALAFAYILAGANAAGRSVFNYDSRVFLAGSAEQLSRPALGKED